VSLARPTAPVEVGFLVTPGKALDVAVAGRYAYVAAEQGGLRVIDIADFRLLHMPHHAYLPVLGRKMVQ
jgi:hypothetical protein